MVIAPRFPQSSTDSYRPSEEGLLKREPSGIVEKRGHYYKLYQLQTRKEIKARFVLAFFHELCI